MPATFRFDAEVWEHDGQGAWHFASLPEDIADDIEQRFGGSAKGFGSIPVRVTIGATTWATSIFPDNKRATYVLPVKKPVRKAEGIATGDVARIDLEVID